MFSLSPLAGGGCVWHGAVHALWCGQDAGGGAGQHSGACCPSNILTSSILTDDIHGLVRGITHFTNLCFRTHLVVFSLLVIINEIQSWAMRIFLIFTKCRSCPLSEVIAIKAKVLIVNCFGDNRSTRIVSILNALSSRNWCIAFIIHIWQKITHQGSIHFTSNFWDVNPII